MKEDLPRIPAKRFFKIGEVSDLTGLKPYVLRYWETEFKEIAPIKSRSRHRLYRQKDVEIIFLIKKLLYEEKFTIAGAKKQLKAWRDSQQGDRSLNVEEVRPEAAATPAIAPEPLGEVPGTVDSVADLLYRIRGELKSLVDMI